MNQPIKLGVSLFSYSSEYYLKKLSLDEILIKAREAGAEAIEIVASQMMPGFPYPDAQWLHSLRERCEKLEMDPFCYSAHLDSGLRSDRWLTDDEKVMSTLNDIRNAYEMGASVVRTQFSISPELLYRVAPYAEKYRVKVGVEIHPPHRLDTEIWQRFLSVFHDLDTPYIGMCVDTGIYQEYPYDGWLNVYYQHGVSRELAAGLLKILAKGGAPDEANAFLESRADVNNFAREMASELFRFTGPMRRMLWRRIFSTLLTFIPSSITWKMEKKKRFPMLRCWMLSAKQDIKVISSVNTKVTIAMTLVNTPQRIRCWRILPWSAAF